MKPARIAKDDPRLTAFRPGPMTEQTEAEIRAMREKFAKKRSERHPVERRAEDRRVGPFDRREGERRVYATMGDKLAAEARKHEERRFSGRPITGFGELP
jgi:hypothetical protein